MRRTGKVAGRKEIKIKTKSLAQCCLLLLFLVRGYYQGARKAKSQPQWEVGNFSRVFALKKSRTRTLFQTVSVAVDYSF